MHSIDCPPLFGSKPPPSGRKENNQRAPAALLLKKAASAATSDPTGFSRWSFSEGMSRREAARVFGIDPRTLAKMLEFSVPPGYRRKKPVRRQKLDAFTGIINQILKADKQVHKKQRHTSKRIFERLRDEYGFEGGITIVSDYICAARRRQREMFVPMSHPAGHAQADFGEALALIGGVERKIHFLVVDLPHSDACFVKAYPGETTEAFCDGHAAAFEFFGADVSLQ